MSWMSYGRKLTLAHITQPYRFKSNNRNRTCTRIVRQTANDEQVDILEGPSSSSFITTMHYPSATFAQVEAEMETHAGADPEDYDELPAEFVDDTDYSNINWYVECLLPGTQP